MPRFISLHSLACLTRQGAEELNERLSKGTVVRARRVLVNLYEGKMLAELEGPDRETVARALAEEKIHYEWLWRVELESAGDKLYSA